MTLIGTVSTLTAAPAFAPPATRALDIVLLGLGRVGTAVASLALNLPESVGLDLRIGGALVRDCDRARDEDLHRRLQLTSDPADLLARRPDVVIEVLGGLEPARTIVLHALERGISVVTANKSLIAAHGDELAAAAARGGAMLRYEASVLAGVPFLGTFAARPLAARIAGVTGIVNGTTNYILTKMEREQQDFEDALADAQRLGLAEPNPSSDVDGVDAVEKLAVLIRHFGRCTVRPADIETRGIRGVQAADLRHAREFGGAIKPVVAAEWGDEAVLAFAGPAFVPADNRLACVDGVENAVWLHREVPRRGKSATNAPGAGSPGPSFDLFYSGPGAGPGVTAATILDDVAEVAGTFTAKVPATLAAPTSTPARRSACQAPVTAWFVRLSGVTLPHGAEIADLLGSYGIWLQRISPIDSSSGGQARYLLTWPCPGARLDRAVAALADAAACDALCIRALEQR